MSTKERLERIRAELKSITASLPSEENFEPLKLVLKSADAYVDQALHETVSIEDPIPGRTRYGTADRAVCPHCGKLNKLLFDDVYYEGEQYDLSCDHCRAEWWVNVSDVTAITTVGLYGAGDGYCLTCHHWAHEPGKCEPYKMECPCPEGSDE